jgi:lipopolysaccharide export system protein LptA
MRRDHTRHTPRHLRTCRALLAVLAIFAASPLAALTGDDRQPINIAADQVELDQRNGLSIYSGNVELTQGSMRLNAGRVIVNYADRHVRKVVAEGTPALYRQRQDGEEAEILARAQRMELHTGSGQLILQDDAELSQGGNRFSSQRIVYDTVNSRITAGAGAPDNGDAAAAPADRVHITIETAPAAPDQAAPAPPPAAP